MSDATPTPREEPRQYLGDSVYAAWLPRDGLIELSTDNGYRPTNLIYFDAAVFIEFLAFAARYPQWIPPSRQAGTTLAP